MRSGTTALTSLALFLSLLTSSALPRPATGEFPRRPKLILILVIDQFRYDYLVRFRPQFVEGGFNLLLRGGADFVDCRFDYATTVTGPGHATLLTGAYPNIHGIIGNEWYDRSLRRMVQCVEDPGTTLVTGSGDSSPAPGSSPARLVGSTLGDELRAATDFRSKVVSIAMKDRAAVLMGGHSPSAVYWYDPKAGGFVTSTYYLPALPDWAAKFNQQSPVKDFCRQQWKALPETPGGAGRVFSEFSPDASEPCPDSRFRAWLDQTPFMNDLEFAFARAAVINEHLGQGPDTDLLAIGLSVNDSIGHANGPYSPQVADCTLRTDRALAAFLADLDRMVGLSNVWIALSADHGVAPTPAFIRDHNLGPGISQRNTVTVAVEQALEAEFGPGVWIEAVDYSGFYLDHNALKAHKVQPARAEEVAAEAAASAPGVMAAFTRSQFMAGTLPRSPLAHKAANSFYPKRSPDVVIVLEPYALPVAGPNTTTHGSPWNYDAQVPLVLWGSEFRPGVQADRCEPVDLAATLAAALGLSQPSGAEGHPLAQALKDLPEKK